MLMNKTTPYPRVCAHRGLPVLHPENSLASFGAAVAAGTQEIEFDLRPWEGGLIICHDPPREGTRYPAFEEVLAAFGNRVIMNIHIKPPGSGRDYDRAVFQSIVDAIDRYGCRESVYFTGAAAVMEAALALAPGIERCCQAGNKDGTIVANALKYRAQKLQFFVPHINPEMIDEARGHAIRCNVFFADDPDDARELFRMGADTVLTNNCVEILQALRMKSNL